MELDTIWSGLTDLVPSTAGLSNKIGDFVSTALNNTIGQVLYGVVSAVNWFIAMVFQLFEVFSGQMKVSYNGDYTYLTNVFFENSAISGIYWGMAIIGVVLCFAFAIISVIRKMFDGSDKIQTSMGAILGSMLKSILIILSLNVVMVAILNFTNVLMQRMVYVFNAGSSLTQAQSIDFTDDQFATMGRVLNTIGNYSLNPSYNSRYNLNSCFNEIRGDMLYLQDQGVFEFYYITEDANGKEIETWQSALQDLVYAANLEEELRMDVYNEGVANVLLGIMETLENNTSFYPLKHYERSPVPVNNIPFDRVLFLACTYNAARNEHFNVNPSHTDALRGPYYSGEKSIYDVEQVSEDFDLLWGFNYIIFFLVVCGILKEMIYVLLDCIARIFNMIVLYLVGPPFIAVTPLDGGAKQKQWILAFVVQCFGVFGTVIAMRLLLIFAPIVISTKLEIFPNAAMDIAAKVILVHAGCLTARKANSMFTGILAESAGWQSITAGSLRGDHDEQERRSEAEADKKRATKDRVAQEKRQKEQEKQQQQMPQQKMQQQQTPQQKMQQQTPTQAVPPNGTTTPPPAPPNGTKTPPTNGTTTPPHETQNTGMGQQDNTLVEQKVEVTDTGTGGGATVNIDGNMEYHAIPVAPGFNPVPQNQQEQGQQNDGPKEPPPPQNDNNAQ